MLQKGILIGAWIAGMATGMIGVAEITSIDEEKDSPTTAVIKAAYGLGNILMFGTAMTIIILSTENTNK